MKRLRISNKKKQEYVAKVEALRLESPARSLAEACQLAGLSVQSYRRWKLAPKVLARQAIVSRAKSLGTDERLRNLGVVLSGMFNLNL